MAIVIWLMKALVPVLGFLFLGIGGIVSGVWLAILGEWGAIGYGLWAMVVSHVLVSFVLMASLLLTVPGRYFEQRRMMAGVHLIEFLGRFYFIAVIAIWCIAVFAFFTMKADARSNVPMLVWSFGVATGPWPFTILKASREGDDNFGIAAIFFSQVGYLVMLAMVLVLRSRPVDALVAFSVVMFASFIFSSSRHDISSE